MKNKVLRCVNSFDETFVGDNTRLVRAIRFKIDKGLIMDSSLEDYIKEHGFERVVNPL